ncbi:unnamed protein product [Orchesella dallaii]|uniref:Peptidase aspartic putative domain-containing protein n=1 Tax=Orchesella dallaii TaxID=48710 RepID=A0ABP1RSD8_9HEXA
MSFRDRFTASIVKNTSLCGSERLEYLNAAVKGEAERVIKSFQITDANFDEAWALLCKRYENNRELVFSILKSFLTQPKMNSESLPALRKLVDVSLQCQRSLAVLKRPVAQWDDMLVYTVVDKLDNSTKREWAKSLTGADMPTFQELLDFLENHIRGLHISASKSSQPHDSGGVATRAAHHSSTNGKCPCCEQAHAIYQCPTFKALSISERVELVKLKHLCFNCLSPKHGVSTCESKHTCRTCHKKHNSLLHLEVIPASGEQNPYPLAQPTIPEASRVANQQSDHDPTGSVVASHFSKVNGTLLATAEVEVQDSTGYFQPCRVFLDPGSESSFVTDKCAARLGLRRKKCDIEITGISSSSAGRASAIASCNVISKVRDFSIHVNALILSKVTANLPSFPVGGAQTWAHLEGLTLADPKFNQPREVDILLGADVTERIFLDGRSMGNILDPIARNSEFGWVIIGPTGANMPTTHSASVRSHSATIEVGQILNTVCKSEEIPNQPNSTEKEKTCENHFTRPHKHNELGQTEELPPDQRDVNLQPFPYQQDVNLQLFPDKRNKDVELPPNKRLLAGPAIQDKCTIPKYGEEDSFPHGKKPSSDCVDAYGHIGGSSSTKQTPILQTQLLSKHCFELRKWDNNNPKVLLNTNFNSIDRNGHTCARYDLSKAPGVRWNSADDLLFLGFKPNPWQQISKRIFNPLGWLTPFQQQWSSVPLPAGKLTLKWDKEVPTQLFPCWQHYQQRLCMPAGNFHVDLEERPAKAFMVLVPTEFLHLIIYKYSCLSKLSRVTAYVLMFICNAHSSNKMSRFCGDLSVQELKCSFQSPVLIFQREFYSETNFLLEGKRTKQQSVIPTSIPEIKLIIGSTTITIEEFFQAPEAILNLWQLGPMSSNPDGYHELTPAQFLIGREITSLPAADYTEITSLPAVDHIKFISLPAAHHNKIISLPAVDDTKIISLSAADYTKINSLLAAFHSTANTKCLSRLQTCHQTKQALWQRWHLKYLNSIHD